MTSVADPGGDRHNGNAFFVFECSIFRFKFAIEFHEVLEAFTQFIRSFNFFKITLDAIYSKIQSSLVIRIPKEQPIDFSGIDTAVHGPVRLGVLTALQVDGALDFTTIAKRLKVTDGAIGTHLLKLEKIEYVSSTKEFVGRRPKSTYKITAKGRKALFLYLETMQKLINSLSGK